MTALRRSPMKRKPRQSVMGDVREQVLERDGGLICRLASDTCQGYVQVHHLLPRGRLGKDVAENAILLCAVHHAKTHANPRQSWAVGLLAHQWDDPLDCWVRMHLAGLAVAPAPSAGVEPGPSTGVEK